jgi:hypothetical protein
MRFTKNFLLGASAIVLAFGCAPSNPGLVAEGVLAADTMCVVQPNNNLIAQGVLDISPDYAGYRVTGISYEVFVRVGNQLINNGNRVYPLMADPNRILINHFEVTLMDTSETTLSLPGAPNPYLVPADGAVGSTQSMDPTFGIASGTVIPDAYGQLLAGAFGTAGGTLLVRIRVIGTTAGGATLTSGPIVYPIALCSGCLFQPSCDAMGNGILNPSCGPGQDGVSQIPPPSGTCP